MIGELFGELNSTLAVQALEAYVAHVVSIDEQPFDECLREFLSGFRLPGEVGVIEKIM